MAINLDILRSIAVLAVFIAHLGLCVDGHSADNSFGYLEAIGRFGVIVFFVHTSLVLMCSMNRTSQEPSFSARFYVRRAFRIYPLAMCAVMCTYLLQIPPNAWSRLVFKPIELLQLGSNLLLIQNVTRQPPVLAVLWSLPLEVQMYIVLPALFIFVRATNWRIRLGVAYAVAGILAAVVWHFTGRLNLFAFVPCFLSGVLAFKRRNSERVLPGWAWPLMVLVLMIGLVLLPIYQRHFCMPVGIAFEWIAAIILGFSWPLFREINSKSIARCAHFVAKYSYGIYLGHTYAMYLVFIVVKITGIPGIIMTIFVTAIFSILGYHLIEEPMINMGKRVAVRVGANRTQTLSSL